MRAPPGNHWNDALPDDDRERYRAAWQSFTACRDCDHWSSDDGDSVGCCGAVRYAAFTTPEDYTCNEFKPKT